MLTILLTSFTYFYIKSFSYLKSLVLLKLRLKKSILIIRILVLIIRKKRKKIAIVK